MNLILILFGKLISWMIKLLKLGHGSTWPGHIALKYNDRFIKQSVQHSHLQIILIAGTNGKTTTAAMLKTILESNNKKVIQNASGANLQNGVASAIILNSNIAGKIQADYAIFEIDENALPQIFRDITPDYLILLNLFRDQLDRYGEVHTIADKWKKALDTVPKSIHIIGNADDPEIAFLGLSVAPEAVYFGLTDTALNQEHSEHAADTMNCPKCGGQLAFTTRFFSHLGDWHCKKCGLTRPKLSISSFPLYPLPGTYNRYNTLAAVRTARAIGLTDPQIQQALTHFRPAFGRQEVIDVGDKKIQIFLSKNPTGFNESLRTITQLKAQTMLLVLNDRVADGTDVSWVWDIDIEIGTDEVKNTIVSGERARDMGLRVKYAEAKNWHIAQDLNEAIKHGLSLTPTGGTLFVLATYTAMLDVRKIVTGKKIL